MRPVLALALLVAGCATTRSFDRSTEPGAPQTGIATSGSVVITGTALSADPGITVLDAIRRVMPQAMITGWTATDNCPHVELRGHDSVSGSSDPDVYVDGTHARDTCPLVTLQAAQTGRIEVYPGGVTSRPGYPTGPHGLILIFVARPDTT